MDGTTVRETISGAKNGRKTTNEHTDEWFKLSLKCESDSKVPEERFFFFFSSRLTDYIVEFTRVRKTRGVRKASRGAERGREEQERLPGEGKSFFFMWDSPDALRSRTLWRSRAIQRAQAGHLQRRWLAAARLGYIPPALCVLNHRPLFHIH